MKCAGGIIAAERANQLGRLERQARIVVARRRIDRETDHLRGADQALANCGPSFRRKGFGRAFRRRLRMQLEGKPAQLCVELSCSLFGPDRAEIAVRSNNVGPDVDDARFGIHFALYVYDAGFHSQTLPSRITNDSQPSTSGLKSALRALVCAQSTLLSWRAAARAF